jgi:hypothetical protein
VQTLATLVTSSGNDKDIAVSAILDNVGEQWMGSARGREFAPADINNVSACLRGLRDGAGKVELRTGRDRTLGSISENGHNQATTLRRNPFDWPVVLAEDHTGDMGAVL